MLDKSQQSQAVAEGGTAVQAGGDVTITHHGLSYSEVREVALDVFRANFHQLAGVAKETASARAKEITEDFIAKLEKENPAGVAKANDPDFQYALFTAQREYARCGDKELESLLVDLLVDRSKQDQRNLLQIVLNESLNTAPKLTEGQLAALALVFLFRYTQYHGAGSHEQLGIYLDRHVLPFATKAPDGHASYQHLEFAGCGSVGVMTATLEHIFSETYQGLFLKGFDASELGTRNLPASISSQVVVPCLNDPSKLQIRALNKDSLKKILDAMSVPTADRAQIEALFEVNRMSESEVRDKLVSIRSYMGELSRLWSTSAMQNFTLTSVGMAIGHANVKRLVGEFANLSIWIS